MYVNDIYISIIVYFYEGDNYGCVRSMVKVIKIPQPWDKKDASLFGNRSNKRSVYYRVISSTIFCTCIYDSIFDKK